MLGRRGVGARARRHSSYHRVSKAKGYHGLVTRPNLFGLEEGALAGVLHELGEPAYRSRQVYSWLYAKRARSFADMTNLGKGLRARLEEAFALRWPEIAETRLSSDGTRKYLFALEGGASIESVSIPEATRRTICISTQAGCPLKCAFCLTGIGGYKRNLKPSEILGQVAAVMEDAPPGTTPWNVVIMGMGEPLLNYEATATALRVLMDPEGFAISPRKLTLSTVGILPALERLMLEPVRPNLAISLHAPNPALRRALMPIEERYPLGDVIEAAKRYPIPSGGLVTYEYVLLRGVNDTEGHAHELARLLKSSRCKVNLIPLNPAPEIPFEAPRPECVDAFGRILAEADITVSVRRPRGQDILAACGQLHLKRASGEAVAALAP
jgi:23S rRNA (adenine2503-C2)-methyltransferase